MDPAEPGDQGPEDHPSLPRGTIKDVADHIDHIVKVAGIDHVGIGSDFDGITRWPEGLEDVSSYLRLTEELLRRGYSETDVHKILGGNVLRAFRQAGNVARRLQASTPPEVDDIPAEEGRLTRSERLQILDEAGPLRVTQLVAEGMPAVAQAEP